MNPTHSMEPTPLPGYGTSLVDRINLYLHFRRHFKMLTQRWLLLLVFVMLGGSAGAWVAWTTPSRFESYSKLMIAPRSRASSVIGVEGGDDPMKFAEAQVLLMTSGQVLNKVYAKIQESRGSSNLMVRPKLEAYPDKGNTCVMKVTATNFLHAQQFAIAWAQEFVEFKRQQKAGMINSTEASTQRDILVYEQRLERARQVLDDFRKKNNIANVADAGQAAAARLERTKAAYQELLTELKLYENANAEQLAVHGISAAGASKSVAAGAEAGVARGTRSREGANAEDIDDTRKYEAGQTYAETKKAIRRVEAEIEDRLKTLKEQHPYVLMLRKTVESLRVDLKTSLELIEEMRLARIQALKTRMDSYPPLIEEFTEEVFRSTSIQNEYQRLLEDEKFIKDNLDGVRRQLQAMAAATVDDEQFQSIESGAGSPEATGPNRPYILAAGCFVGLMLGLGVMYLLHRLDDRMDQPEDIERHLAEPICGQLPEVDKSQFTEGYLLITRMKQQSVFSEALRGVRSGLLLSPEGASKRLLAVTSAVPGDGKTTFTTNFALILASAGHKTLLVDADMRRGNIHGYFEQPLEGGLSEVLMGKKSFRDVVRATPVPNLHLMTSGERPANPSELLIGPNARELARALRAEFDYVIFDCPPLTAIDDTFSLSDVLDGLFFVVRAGRTPMRFARMAVNTIRQRGTPLLGVVVNGISIDNPYYYYTTYYYSAYYHRDAQGKAVKN